MDRFYDWLDERIAKKKKICIVEIGAGTVIPTIRNLGDGLIGRYENISLIRINPRENDVGNERSVGIAMGAKAAIEAITGA